MDKLITLLGNLDGFGGVADFLRRQSYKLNGTQRLSLYEMLRRLIANKYSYVDAFKKIRDISSEIGMKKDRRFAKEMRAVQLAISRFETSNVGLGDALEGVIPDTERNIISAAEPGQKYEMGLRLAEDLAKKGMEIKKKFAIAILYPSAILAVLIGIMFFFAYQLFPMFAEVKPVSEWPQIGRISYTVSTSVVYWGPGIVIFSALLTAAMYYLSSNWVGSRRDWMDEKFPLFKLYATIKGAILLISLSAYMQAGIPFDNAIKRLIAENRSNRWLDRNLRKISMRTRELGHIGKAMNLPMFDVRTRAEIFLFSLSNPKEFSIALHGIGSSSLERAQAAVLRASSSLKYLLLALTGGLIALMYISVLQVSQGLV